ncbi:hypothetical protein [Acinetobacter haemolyticus]|uniref:hypothetical protein n=1 Tax=Acinetobacter haemolyticus TaxID=29430 RepID=UPI0002E47DF5|nr:hypothetical protein [Acinetobacter haemolyticus]NAS00126.1 hypothetical protein [Acinetobacter haemolyticus]
MTVLSVGDNEEVIHFFMGVRSHFESVFKDPQLDVNSLINSYYSKFTNEKFVGEYGLALENQELWEHWGYFEVALRVYYYEVLNHNLDKLYYIKWLNNFIKEYRTGGI